MSDRELLEVAAKAAGIELQWFDGHSVPGIKGLSGNSSRCWFSPLTDDGDALRLAVKLRLHISLENEVVSAWAKDNYGNFQTERFYDRGDEAATRRAIVRAAAAIGGAPQPLGTKLQSPDQTRNSRGL